MHHLLRTCWAAIGRDGTLVGGVGVVTPVCGNVVPGTALDDGRPDEDLLVVGLYDIRRSLTPATSVSSCTRCPEPARRTHPSPSTV